MNRLITGICLFIPFSQAIPISMTVCSDDVCSKDCISWTATTDRCSPCQPNLGACSSKNPSSIVTTSSMTLYSDSTCQKVIPGTQNMNLLMDSGCNVLIGDKASHFGSYKAINTGAIIGGLVGGSFLLFAMCICACCLCKRCRDIKIQRQNNQNNVNLPPSTYIAPLVPYPMHVSYSSPPIIQEPQHYHTQALPQQYFPPYYHQAYDDPSAPVAPSAPAPSAPPSYYPSKPIL